MGDQAMTLGQIVNGPPWRTGYRLIQVTPDDQESPESWRIEEPANDIDTGETVWLLVAEFSNWPLAMVTWSALVQKAVH